MTALFDSTTNQWIDTDNVPITYAYNGDGTISTATAVHGESSWVKTYAYTSGNLTGESAWVKQ